MRVEKVTEKEGRYYFQGIRDFSLIAAFSYAAASYMGYTDHELAPIVIPTLCLAFATFGHFTRKYAHKMDWCKKPPPDP